MGMLGKSIAVAIASIFGYFIYRVVYGIVSGDGILTQGWTPMTFAMLAAIPVTILAVGVTSMLIRPSLFEEQRKQINKRMRKGGY